MYKLSSFPGIVASFTCVAFATQVTCISYPTLNDAVGILRLVTSGLRISCVIDCALVRED